MSLLIREPCKTFLMSPMTGPTSPESQARGGTELRALLTLRHPLRPSPPPDCLPTWATP